MPIRALSFRPALPRARRRFRSCRLSENDKLRLVFPVSVSYVSSVKAGDRWKFGGIEAPAAFWNRRAFDPQSGYSNAKNGSGSGHPQRRSRAHSGVYASVVLKMDRRNQTLVVPVEALSRSHTTTAYVINQANCIEERILTLGLESPHKSRS